MSSLRMIPIADIVNDPKKGGLRDVQRDHERFQGIVESMRAVGVLNSISVRYDEATGKYLVIDGHQRRAAAEEAGLTEMPCQIFSINEADVPIHQIIGNLMSVPTKPAQYAQQLKRILMLPKYQAMSRQEFCASLGITETVGWLNNMLSLNDLPEEVQALVDQKLIPLTNAYFLAKLPSAEEMLDFIEYARNEDSSNFSSRINGRLQEIRNAKKGISEAAVDPITTAKGRKLGELKTRYTELTAKMQNTNLSPTDKAFVAGQFDAISWAIQLDEATVKAKEAEKEAKKKSHEEKLIQRRETMKALQAEVKKYGVENVKVVPTQLN